MSTQLCLNCGGRPALPSIGVLPLCSACSTKVSKRGVKVETVTPPKVK